MLQKNLPLHLPLLSQLYLRTALLLAVEKFKKAKIEKELLEYSDMLEKECQEALLTFEQKQLTELNSMPAEYQKVNITEQVQILKEEFLKTLQEENKKKIDELRLTLQSN